MHLLELNCCSRTKSPERLTAPVMIITPPLSISFVKMRTRANEVFSSTGRIHEIHYRKSLTRVGHENNTRLD